MNQPLSLDERMSALAAIAAEIKGCPKCKLAETRRNAVPGAGPTDAQIMFIGEGPGFYEDQQGLPFVGASGKFLEEMLALIGMDRSQVFITNVVKCRPPENRDPEPDEIDICTKNYLYRQIDLIQPKVIVTLGRYSMGLFFPKAKITAIHGQPKQENGRVYLPMFHPAAVLRNQSLRPQAEADMRKLPALLAEAAKLAQPQQQDQPKGQTQDKDAAPPTQLSLF